MQALTLHNGRIAWGKNSLHVRHLFTVHSNYSLQNNPPLTAVTGMPWQCATTVSGCEKKVHNHVCL